MVRSCDYKRKKGGGRRWIQVGCVIGALCRDPSPSPEGLPSCISPCSILHLETLRQLGSRYRKPRSRSYRTLYTISHERSRRRAQLSIDNTYQLNSPMGLDLRLATIPPKNALKLRLSGALRGSLPRVPLQYLALGPALCVF